MDIVLLPKITADQFSSLSFSRVPGVRPTPMVCHHSNELHEHVKSSRINLNKFIVYKTAIYCVFQHKMRYSQQSLMLRACYFENNTRISFTKEWLLRFFHSLSNSK